MILKQLLLFHDLKNYASFREASLALKIPESSIRSLIHNLEKELSCSLLITGKRGYQFTQTGEKILAHTHHLHTTTQQLYHLQATLNQVFSHRIFLESGSQFASLILTKVITEILQPYPTALFSLITTNNQSVIIHIAEQSAQLGLLQIHELEKSQLCNQIHLYKLQTQPLFDDKICFLAGPTHPFYAQEFVDLKSLLQCSRLVSKDRTDEILYSFFKTNGYAKNILQVSNIMMQRKLIAATNYISWQSMRAAQNSLSLYRDNLHIIQISDFIWKSTIYSVYNPMMLTFGEKLLLEKLQHQFQAMQCE